MMKNQMTQTSKICLMSCTWVIQFQRAYQISIIHLNSGFVSGWKNTHSSSISCSRTCSEFDLKIWLLSLFHFIDTLDSIIIKGVLYKQQTFCWTKSDRSWWGRSWQILCCKIQWRMASRRAQWFTNGRIRSGMFDWILDWILNYY